MLNKEIFLDEKIWREEWHKRNALIQRRCSRCAYHDQTPGIVFDEKGICNYCYQQDQLTQQYPGGTKGQSDFLHIVETIKKEGKKQAYDVIVGVSGGCDSSYLISLAKEVGLRPLAVHFDNTWNSTIAVQNIQKVLQKLNVELWTHVVNNEEYDDLYLAILKAGVPDLEAPTDLALASTLNIAASKFKVRYVFEGHSFKSEGLSPLGWLYMDAQYVQDMHQKFGCLKQLKTYPHMWFSRQLKWMLFNRLKKIRPLWYLDYNKEAVKADLVKKFGWEWYGGHHLENRMTAFYHSYFLPRRFNIDQRVNGYSALIRSGQMNRTEALEILTEPPNCDLELVEMIKRRWKLSNEDFVALMTLPIKKYTDYKTYKPLFEKLRPFFYLMAKMELIPWSFYIKYTAKSGK